MNNQRVFSTENLLLGNMAFTEECDIGENTMYTFLRQKGLLTFHRYAVPLNVSNQVRQNDVFPVGPIREKAKVRERALGRAGLFL